MNRKSLGARAYRQRRLDNLTFIRKRDDTRRLRDARARSIALFGNCTLGDSRADGNETPSKRIE